jgi:hypothetical protein
MNYAILFTVAIGLNSLAVMFMAFKNHKLEKRIYYMAKALRAMNESRVPTVKINQDPSFKI